jgi:chromosome segregation ATPase
MVVVCLGLAIALITIKKQAGDQHTEDTTKILSLSNNWVAATGKWEEQKQVTATLYQDIENQKKLFNESSNRLSTELVETSNTLSQTKTDLEASKREVAKRDAKITELETENQQLDKQALDLSTAITNLTSQIADTEKRLAASEGDKAYLMKELDRLKAEKAELERQFNDLTVLRAQVAKLKEELNIARRLEWIRQGLFARADQKGAQQLMQGAGGVMPVAAKATKPAYDLNVEVSADGSVKVIPPLGAATNSPAGK